MDENEKITDENPRKKFSQYGVFFLFLILGIFSIFFCSFVLLPGICRFNTWNSRAIENCIQFGVNLPKLVGTFVIVSSFIFFVVIRKFPIFPLFIFSTFLLVLLLNKAKWEVFISFDSPRERAVMDLDTIRSAILLYEANTGKSFSDTTGKILIGKYLRETPLDPGGNPYSFASATDKFGATIFSIGPDGIAGTSDDIVRRYKTLSNNPTSKNPGQASQTKTITEF